MDLKKVTLQSIWKMNKEKLIFIFCSGLLLFILSLPGDSDSVVAEAGNSTQIQAEATGNSGQNLTDPEYAAPAANVKASGQETTYEAALESRIRAILEHVEGVGEVDVMVVLKSTEEKVIRVDRNTSTSTTEEHNSGTVTRTQTQNEWTENTVMDGQTSAPIIEKELSPELSGIIISADGGGSAVIKAEISEAMEALFGLPSHKIKVLKRVKKESEE